MNTCTMKIIIATLPLLAAGCSQSHHALDKDQAQLRWNDVRGRIRCQLAQQQLAGGHLEDAVRSASESIALSPAREDAYITLAIARMEQGAIKAAWQALQAARAAGHDSAVLAYTEGVTLEQQNKIVRALEQYHAARVIEPGNPDYLTAEVESLVALGRPREALALLDEDTERFGNHAGLALLDGRIALMVEDTDRALARYRSASALRPADADIQASYGLLLARVRRFRAAEAQLEPLIHEDDGNTGLAAVRRALAACYLDRGAAAAARDVLGPYTRAHPHDARALALLARAAIALNDTLTALHHVDAARRHMPDSVELWLLRATVQWRRGDLDGATESLHTVLEKNPDDADAYCMLGEVLLEQDAEPTARACFERALVIDPASSWASARLRALDSNLSDVGSG